MFLFPPKNLARKGLIYAIATPTTRLLLSSQLVKQHGHMRIDHKKEVHSIYHWKYVDTQKELQTVKRYYDEFNSMSKFFIRGLSLIFCAALTNPDCKVRGTNMGPTWVLSAPDGPHVGPMNLAFREMFHLILAQPQREALQHLGCIMVFLWHSLSGVFNRAECNTCRIVSWDD